jgi:hypothetical protein
MWPSAGSATGQDVHNEPWNLPAERSLHRFDLLHHPLVYAQLREWLSQVMPDGDQPADSAESLD